MDCIQAREEFSALLDGELAPEQRTAVESHLSLCSDCLRELDGLKRVDGHYRQLAPVPAPAGLEERVRQGLRPNLLRFPRLHTRRRPLWPVLAAAAGLVFVVGAALVLFVVPQGRMRMAATDVAPEMALSVEAEEPVAGEAPPAAIRMRAQEPSAEAMAELRNAPPAPQEMAEADAADVFMAERKAEELARSDAYFDHAAEAAPNAPIATGAGGIAADEHQRRFQAEPPAPESPKRAAGTAAQAAEQAEPSLFAEAPAVDEAVPAPLQSAPPAAAPTPPMPMQEEPVPLVLPQVAAPAEAGFAQEPQASAPEEAAVAETPPAPPTDTGAAPEPPASTAEVATAREAAPPSAQYVVGERVFALRNGVWEETGYAGQDTVPLVRGSEALQNLLAAHPNLAPALEIGERIVFKAGDAWYRLSPAP